MKTSVKLAFAFSLPVSLSIALAPAEAQAACPSRLPTAADAVADVISAYGSSIFGMCVVGVDSMGNVARDCDGERSIGGSAVDTDTLFSIGSVTKTMTATLLALRASQYSVYLLQNVEDFLPYSLSTNKKTITLLSLATHHSGLQKWPDDAFNLDHFYANTALCTTDQGPNLGTTDCWDPSQNWSYSNWGFDLLGNVLAEHDLFHTWADDNYISLMLPLAMNDTMTAPQWIDSDPIDFGLRFATGYDLSGGFPVAKPIKAEHTWEEAGGSLYSSIEDLQRWLLYNMGKSGPSSLTNLLPTIRTVWGDGGSFSDDIGLAWQIDDDGCEATNTSYSSKRYSKGGGGPLTGSNAYVAYSIVKGKSGTTMRGAVVLLNVDSGAQEIAKKLLHTLP